MGVFGNDGAAPLVDEAIDQPVRQAVQIVLVLLKPFVGEQAAQQHAMLLMPFAAHADEMIRPGHSCPVSLDLVLYVAAFRRERQAGDGPDNRAGVGVLSLRFWSTSLKPGTIRVPRSPLAGPVPAIA